MSQDQRTQCETKNFITFVRHNIKVGSVKNEIFNERHSGFLQAAFIPRIYLQRYIPVTNL
jgi:hypothetical protein